MLAGSFRTLERDISTLMSRRADHIRIIMDGKRPISHDDLNELAPSSET
jgi:hypothetical protein